MNRGIRIIFYVLILVALGLGIEYKKAEKRKERKARVESVLGLKQEQGQPVLLEEVNAKTYYSQEIVTLQKCGKQICFYSPYTFKKSFSKNSQLFDIKDQKHKLGKVVRISSKPNYRNGLYQVDVSLDKQTRDVVKEKGFMNAMIRYGQQKKGVLIPPEAVFLNSKNESFVWLSKDKKAHQTPIQTHFDEVGSSFIVEKGLQKGDLVVVSGGALLNENDLLFPVEANKSEVIND